MIRSNPQPLTAEMLDAFMRRVAAAPRRALMLDYDGTLAPFRTERNRAVPYGGVREVMKAIAATGQTRLVIVSGRWTEDLIPLLGLEPVPEMWGSHGWEHRLSDGRVALGPMPEAALTGLEEAERALRAQGLSKRCEVKPGCVALHMRGLVEAEARTLEQSVGAQWRTLADDAGLELKPFDGGLELRVPGRNKGDAVRAVLAEMEPEAAVAYMGDDLTDEDAFEALGERGFTGLVRTEPRPTAARAWLRPPGELLQFLKRWQQSTGGNR